MLSYFNFNLRLFEFQLLIIIFEKNIMITFKYQKNKKKF